MTLKLEQELCKHFEYCSVRKLSEDRDCSDYENCQTYKFWEKYSVDNKVGAGE